jgi:hypothetical protein
MCIVVEVVEEDEGPLIGGEEELSIVDGLPWL